MYICGLFWWYSKGKDSKIRKPKDAYVDYIGLFVVRFRNEKRDGNCYEVF